MKKFHSTVFLLLLFFSLFLTSTSCVNAGTRNTSKSDGDTVVIEEKNITVTITYLLSKNARYNRYFPIRVSITNQEEEQNTTVGITLVNSNQENVTYGKKVNLLKDQKVEVDFLLPMNRATQDLNLTIVTNQNDTLVESKLPFNVANYASNRVVGILSDRPIGLSYFCNFGNDIIYLNKDHIPNNYLIYDMIDYLVIDEYDVTSMDDLQKKTLKEYVKHGGTIVWGMDCSHSNNLTYLLREFDLREMPIKNLHQQQANVTLLSNKEFIHMQAVIQNYEKRREEQEKLILGQDGNQIGDLENRVYLGSSMLTDKTITDLFLKSESKELYFFELQDSISLMQWRNHSIVDNISYGKGNMILYHFSLQNPNITAGNRIVYNGCSDQLLSEFYTSIVYQVNQHLSSVNRRRREQEEGGYYDSVQITGVTDSLQDIKSPNIKLYILLSAFYIIMLIPVLYLILRFKKKQQSVYWTVPLISIVFTILFWMIGKPNRIHSTYMRYFAIDSYGMGELCGHSYSTIGSGKDKELKLFIPSADTTVVENTNYPQYYDLLYQPEPKEAEFYDYANSDVYVVQLKDSWLLEFQHAPAFQEHYVETTYHEKANDMILSEIYWDQNNQLVGTITNQSDAVIENSFLYLCGYYIYIGKIRPQETIDLNSREHIYASDMNNIMFTQNKIRESLGLNRQLLNQQQNSQIMLYDFFYRKYLACQEDLIFFGEQEEIPDSFPQKELIDSHGTKGIHMVMQKLDYKHNNIIPCIDSYLKEPEDNNYDIERRYTFNGSLNLNYQFPYKNDIKELFLSSMFHFKLDPEVVGYGQCNKIYFYNTISKTFDLVFDLDKGYQGQSISKEKLASYLDSEMNLKVRYETEDTGENAFMIPVISIRKE